MQDLDLFVKSYIYMYNIWFFLQLITGVQIVYNEIKQNNSKLQCFVVTEENPKICTFIVGNLVRFWKKILEDVSRETSPYKTL